MQPYIHNVKFYETDKMNITHHSNYVRWMEEARLDYLQRIGCDYRSLEAACVISPVVSVKCKFIKTTTFGDDVTIAVTVKKFNGIRLIVAYEMRCGEETVCKAESEHCFVNDKMKVVNLKRVVPDYYERFAKVLAEN